MKHQKIRKVVAVIGVFAWLSGLLSGYGYRKAPESPIDGSEPTVPAAPSPFPISMLH